jgi:arylsulfatase
MRGRLLLTGLVLVALGCGPARSPSILMITIDTLRADHLGCYGYFRDTSPTIDALAREGVLFENAIATSGTTLPSHTSLMTSSYLARHGVRGNFDSYQTPVPADEGDLQTFAQALKAAGYDTAAFTSVYHLRPESGITAGFDSFGGVPGREPREGIHRITRPANVTTAEAVRWLERRRRDPFFLWIHYFDPHSPYKPPPEYLTRYRVDQQLVDFMHSLGVPRRLLRWSADVHNRYDAEIRHTDDRIGELLSALRAQGLYDDLAIVLIADHGEGLGQHGVPEHAVLYQEQIRVPLILRLPGGERAGERIGELVSMIDVVPTLVAALGLPISTEPFDGIDMFSERREYALSEREHSTRRFGSDESLTLTGERWKYELHTEQSDALYDLKADPTELENLFDRKPEVGKTMRDEIQRTVKSANARGEGLALKGATSPEMREALEALGYVE